MIILVGPSASGKTAIAKHLIRYGYQKFVTTTTRKKRFGENDGVDYFFVSREEFQKYIKEDLFIEHTIYNDNYYGSFKKENGENKVLIVEPNGLKSFKALNDKNIVSFYIKASEETRIKRMKERGDKENDIKKRIENDRIVFPDNLEVDFVIDNENEDLDRITQKIISIYKEKIK